MTRPKNDLFITSEMETLQKRANALANRLRCWYFLETEGMWWLNETMSGDDNGNYPTSQYLRIYGAGENN